MWWSPGSTAAVAALGRLSSDMGFDEKLVQFLDIAASSPDTIQFQQTLNSWLKCETHCSGVAFLLLARETGHFECRVCNERELKEHVDFGDSSTFATLFAYCDELSVRRINQGLRDKVWRLWKEINCASSTPATPRSDAGDGTSLPSATLVPIQSKRGLIAALCLFHKDSTSAETELRWLKLHLRLIAALLAIVLNIEEQRRLAKQSEIFLSMAQNVFSSLQDMSLLVRNITKEAKTLVQAETCSLFLLDKEHDELVAEVFEKNGLTDDYLNEIRLPITHGIAGHVATTGVMMNVKDAYSNPLFYREVDQRTGFFTRNILCFPIKDSDGELVGVAELCNKIGRPSFTHHDEEIATTFAVYCAISISHCLLYRKLQEAHKRSYLASELMIDGSHSQVQIAEEDILRLTVRDIPSTSTFDPEFNSFQFLPRSRISADTQLESCVSMFQSLGFLDKWRIRRRTLARFLTTVQKGYRDVPYHNWGHAFSVCHFAYLLLNLPRVKQYLTDLERFALLVASLCHDIDHRGTTNAFQVQSKTPLAQLYSSEGSVLERHHFAQTICILNMEDCNIFDSLSRKEYQAVLDNVREIILATDLAAHLRKVPRIKQLVKEGFDKSNTEHHYLVLCLLMTASDLSDQSKAWEFSKGIAHNIYREFFSQGDLEKAMGNRPSEMMDRERAWVPKIQLDFLDNVALPLFHCLSEFLNECKPTYDSTIRSRRCWSVLDGLLASEAQSGKSARGVDFFQDTELERRVLADVDHQGGTCG